MAASVKVMMKAGAFFFLMFGGIIWTPSSSDASRILAMPTAATDIGTAPSIVQVTTLSSCSQHDPANINRTSTDGDQQKDYSAGGGGGGGGTVCTLCQQFTSQALYYVTQNKTQSEIIDSLHQACSLLHSSFIQQQCMAMVDQHVSLFFQEIAAIKPSEFCRKLNLCGTTTTTTQLLAAAHEADNTVGIMNDSSQVIYQDFCALCHCALATLLAKLKEPTSQQQIIQVLILKGCAIIEQYVGGCEELLMKYGPLLLNDLEQFLETFTCNSIHACLNINN